MTNPIWHQLPRESPEAYEAFGIYRDLGTRRTLSAVVYELGKSMALISRWSSRWDWVERCRAWDTHEQHVRDKARLAEAARWAERDQRRLERQWERAGRLDDKAEQMLGMPLTSRVVVETYPDGREKTVQIIVKENWRVRDAAELMRLASELENYAVDRALPKGLATDGEADNRIDPDLAARMVKAGVEGDPKYEPPPKRRKPG